MAWMASIKAADETPSRGRVVFTLGTSVSSATLLAAYTDERDTENVAQIRVNGASPTEVWRLT